jgi:hypothetical protein
LAAYFDVIMSGSSTDIGIKSAHDQGEASAIRSGERGIPDPRTSPRVGIPDRRPSPRVGIPDRRPSPRTRGLPLGSMPSRNELLPSTS